jgi:diaminohydroxyphosphoribosylaminopyrimidine deaminase/5-amino-6-(5-phosphoribosylamino)uracil reductase
MRHASDAVLTGIGTVLADDPWLTDRTGLKRRRPLVRVVLDSRLRLPLRSKLARSAAGDVLVVTRASENSAKAYALESADVELLRITNASRSKKPVRRSRAAGLPLDQVLQALGELDLLAVMIEAGPRLMAAALEEGIVDKAVLFYAPRFVGGSALPMLPARGERAGERRARHAHSLTVHVPELHDITLRRFGTDFAVEGYLHDVYRNH